MSAYSCMLRLGVSTVFIHVVFSVHQSFSCPHTYKHTYEGKHMHVTLSDDDTLTYQITSGVSLVIPFSWWNASCVFSNLHLRKEPQRTTFQYVGSVRMNILYNAEKRKSTKRISKL